LRRHPRLSRAISFALLSSLLASTAGQLLTPTFANAQGMSPYSAQEIQALIEDSYERNPTPTQLASTLSSASDSGSESTSHQLHTKDFQREALVIINNIALLNVEQHNLVCTALVVDYRQRPEARQAIENIVDALGVVHAPHDEDAPESSIATDTLRAQLRDEVGVDHRQQAIHTVLDDILIALVVAHGVQGIRGLMDSWNSGLEEMAVWRNVKNNVVARLSSMRLQKLAAVGLGTATGIAHAVYEYRQTHKEDPSHMLDKVQGEIARDLIVQALQLQADVKAFGLDAPAAITSAVVSERRARLTELELKSNSLNAEMGHIYQVAQQYRSDLEPTAKVIKKVNLSLTQLSAKLDKLESAQGPKLK
jgi:hypothetical protein